MTFWDAVLIGIVLAGLISGLMYAIGYLIFYRWWD